MSGLSTLSRKRDSAWNLDSTSENPGTLPFSSPLRILTALPSPPQSRPIGHMMVARRTPERQPSLRRDFPVIMSFRDGSKPKSSARAAAPSSSTACRIFFTPTLRRVRVSPRCAPCVPLSSGLSC